MPYKQAAMSHAPHPHLSSSVDESKVEIVVFIFFSSLGALERKARSCSDRKKYILFGRNYQKKIRMTLGNRQTRTNAFYQMGKMGQ
jgi:hypothetical protein